MLENPVTISVVSIYTATDSDRELVQRDLEHIIRILRQNPAYKACHIYFDADQLCEYLRQHQDDHDVFQLIEEERLLMGPWFARPNYCFAGAESLVRNLLFGHLLGQETGSLLKVGFSSLECLHNSQLPQILNGFNIDTVFIPGKFGRAISPPQFIWQGADNRRAVGQTGFAIDEYYDPDKGVFREKLWHEIRSVANHFPVLLFCNFDSTCDPERLFKLIDQLNREPDFNARLTTLSDFFWMLKEEEYYNELPIITNDHIVGQLMWCDGRLTDRVELQSRATLAERLLQFYLEPWQMITARLVEGTLDEDMKRLWSDLMILESKVINYRIENDSNITELKSQFDMLIRRARDLTQTNYRRLAERISFQSEKVRATGILILNPFPHRCTKISKIWVDIPRESDRGSILVKDHRGRVIPCCVLDKELIQPMFDHHEEGEFQRYQGLLELKDMPSMGYRTFSVIPVEETKVDAQKLLSKEHNVLENDFIKVTILANGTLTIYSKETGITYQKQAYFRDLSFTKSMQTEQPLGSLDTRQMTPEIRAVINNPLWASYKIEYRWNTSPEFDNNNQVKLIETVSLSRLSKYVGLDIEIISKSHQHQLDLCFPIEFKIEHIYTDLRFDLERYREAMEVFGAHKGSSRFSMNSFVGLSNEIAGFAVVSRELKSFKLFRNNDNNLGFTISNRFWHGPQGQPNSRVPTVSTFHFSFFPYLGYWDSGKIFRDIYSQIIDFQVFPLKKGGDGLPTAMEFLRIKPDNLIFSALKSSEKDDGFVLRVFNPSADNIKGQISTYLPLSAVMQLSLEELVIRELDLMDEHHLSVTVAPKQVLTFHLKFK